MAAGLKLASKNQTLRLILRALIAGLVVLWMRSGSFGVVSTFLFFAILIFLYTKPPLHSGRFLSSMLVLALLPFLVPKTAGVEEVFVAAAWGVLLMILLGVKNVILLKRKEIYYVLHLVLVAVSTAFLFSSFNFILEIVIFIVFLFLFREFYAANKSTENSHQLNLISSVEALIAVEIAWAMSFLSVNFLAGAALLTLFIFIFHDTATHYLKGTLSKEIIVRNAILFTILSVIIFFLPV